MAELSCLHTAQASLILEQRAGQMPLWRHFGLRVNPTSAPDLAWTRGAVSFSLDLDIPLSSAPGAEQGWLGQRYLELKDGAGKTLPFRPDEVAVKQTGSCISITAHDKRRNVTLHQSFEALDGGAFRLAASIKNASDAEITVTKASSAMIPLPASCRQVVSWRGRHNAELVEQIEPMPSHGWMRETRRGISGHGGPPGLYILGEGATFHSGLVIAMQLAWSGDTLLTVERDDEGYWIAGAEAVGDRIVAPGKDIALPAVILAVSDRGRNGAMAMQHAAMRGLIAWPGKQMRPRPVHLNSWEACYFNHDADRILELAAAAKAIGAERFVLDDGWFKGRHSDNAALGDWTADPRKYPEGLGPLSNAITAMGLEFGLWVEPEMVNPDSDLFRAHPDWALSEDAMAGPTSRNQLVLDMRKAEVRDYLFSALDRLLSDQPISYLKWDHNRDHAPSGGPAQLMGTYDLLARVRAAHPDLEIEGCAGGGGRSDAGILPYVHRFWTSDNVDAVARIGMQRSFLAFLPPEIMGSHVGASPSHATGRTQSLGFRAAIACMGHMGVELDPESFEVVDREKLAGWLGFYQRWRSILHGGTVYLGEGSDGILWQAQGSNGEFLLFVIRAVPAKNRRPQPLPLPFAAEGQDWHVRLLEIAENIGPHIPRQAEFITQIREGAQVLSGSWLAQNGLPLPAQQAESVAIYHLRESAA